MYSYLNSEPQQNEGITIRPFKGYIANREIAESLISPPYDVLSFEEARATAQSNPHSFLHVNMPILDTDHKEDSSKDEIYKLGRHNLEQFIKKGWLEQDDIERYYIYRITTYNWSQTGIICGSSIHDYETNKIKKHEHTREKKENDRTRLTESQGANIGPVVLTYKSDQKINEYVSNLESQNPYIDVVTDDKIRHTLWKVDQQSTVALTEMFAKVSSTYIADGHHRAASAYNVAQKKKQKAIHNGYTITGEEDYNYFMTLLYPNDQLRILEYNRVIKDLNGLTPEQFLQKITENFDIIPLLSRRPQKQHQFSLYLEGKWIGLQAKPQILRSSNIVANIDTHILTKYILDPILDIRDLRNSQRIDFVSGSRGLDELERKCQDDFVAAFALFPISVADVMAIADSGEVLPPKSTWFDPKPRSGLVVRVFQD